VTTQRGAPRLLGRVDHDDPAGPRFAWPGCAVHLRFSGRTIAVRLRASGDHFRVVLDGAPRPPLLAEGGPHHLLAEGLAEGAHELVLTKRTEALVGEAQLLGVELAPGGELLPPPPPAPRRLELIGDSITAGFGVLAASADEPFTPATEAFDLSFGALLAEALGAEPIALAWSGRGVCRNYAGEPGEPMPVLYERTLPARAASRWDFTRWVPHAVLVNLGTNDLSPGGPPPEALFVDAYAGLLRRVRAAYPAAPILCLLGPLLEGDALQTARGFLARALERARRAGEPPLLLHELPPQAPADGLGASGHPSARTQRLMATRLAPLLRGLLRW